jgi:hypothetical protein
MRILVGMMALLGVVGCSGQDAGGGGSMSKIGAPAAANENSQKQDAALVHVQLGEPSLLDVPGSTTLKVPGLDITLLGADFAELLACTKGYVLKGPKGNNVSEIDAKDATKLEQLRFAFLQAKAAVNECRILGAHVVQKVVQDIAAQKGEFFYVANPCVLIERSKDPAANCSFDLAISKPILFAGTGITDAFSKAATEVVKLEGPASELISKFFLRFQDLKNEAKACSGDFLASEQGKSVLQGADNVLAAGLPAVTSMLVGGMSGDNVTKFLGDVKTVLSVSLPQGVSCPKLDQQIAEGKKEFVSIQTQIASLVAAQSFLSKLNPEYKAMGEGVLKLITTAILAK